MTFIRRLRDRLERSPAPAWWLFGIATLARALFVTRFFENRTYFADEAMYLRLADVVAGGLWLGEGTLAAPGPVYFLGLLRALGLDPAGIRIVQALVGGAAVGIYFLIARRIFGGLTAGLAGLIMAVYPYLLYLPGVFYPQNVFELTLAITFYAILRWIQAPAGTEASGPASRPRGTRPVRITDSPGFWLTIAGLSLGLSALFVVPILSAAPLLALWIVLAGQGSFFRRVRAVSILAVLSLATILPWTARNLVVTRQFIFISAMGPQAFYWANNATVDPYARDPERWLIQNQKRLNEEQARQGMNALELDKHLAYRSERFMKAHPGRAFRNYLIRLAMFFDVAPRSFTSNVHTRDRRSETVAILSSVPVLLLAPLGIWFARKRWRLWLPLAAVPIAQALSYAAFHVSVRYRFPFEPCFILFAVVGLLGFVWPEELKADRTELSAGD